MQRGPAAAMVDHDVAAVAGVAEVDHRRDDAWRRWPPRSFRGRRRRGSSPPTSELGLCEGRVVPFQRSPQVNGIWKVGLAAARRRRRRPSATAPRPSTRRRGHEPTSSWRRCIDVTKPPLADIGPAISSATTTCVTVATTVRQPNPAVTACQQLSATIAHAASPRPRAPGCRSSQA